MYKSGTLPESITESSTATNCIHVIPESYPTNGYSSFTIFTSYEDQIETELRSFFQQGYVFNVGNVCVTCSIHQNRLRDAKQNLLTVVKKIKPSVYELQKIILELGVALNIQIDKDSKVFGNPSVRDNINDKLRVLGLELDNQRLFKKHQNLNKFYNITKHAKKLEDRRLEDLLKSPDGLIITIDYFETIKRVFCWYYKRHAVGVPKWDELRPVTWSFHHVRYRFLYDRIWL